MKLYRLCRRAEVQQILDNQSFDNVGNYCCNSERNSHKYNESIRYLHFFKNKSDLLYLNTLVGRFICIYDIPEHLLSEYGGYGKYRDYFKFVKLINVEEFAIPSQYIKFDFLENVFEIIRDIDIEDMYEDASLIGLISEIYNHKLNENSISNTN